MMQKDMKKLVAYSSVSHLGFCTLGIFALTPHGLSGSVIQQINHGLSTGALFLLIGVLYERRHTRLISEFGGLSTPMPNFAAIYMIATLSSLGLPLLNGFIGEFTILRGILRGQHPVRGLGRHRHRAGRGVFAVALPAGDVRTGDQSRERTLAGSERARIRHADSADDSGFWIGIYPKPLFTRAGAPVQQIVEQVNPGYYNAATAQLLAQPSPSLRRQRQPSQMPRRHAARLTEPTMPRSARNDCCGRQSGAGSPRRNPEVAQRRRRSTERYSMDTAAFRHDFFLILPEMKLVLFGLAILLFDFMLGVKDKSFNAVFGHAGRDLQRHFALPAARRLAPDAVGGFNSSIVVDPVLPVSSG